MAKWHYSGLTKDRLALFYCTDCFQMFIQPSPTRCAPIEVMCPKCHAEMDGCDNEPHPRNCYTCRKFKTCKKKEKFTEDMLRDDVDANCWRGR